MNVSRKPNPSKDSAETARDIITTSGQIQSLKIPDAVAALAQAAAKANGETEKYLPGWPLFSPPKVQLDKCTKCSREFCSSINFRRHTRVHRRTLKIDKDFPKNRDHLASFWNKLTVDDASTILSLSDVVVEGVTGSSILAALSSWMCKPGYTSLPVAYARAGSELLDLIQTKASVLPVSSNELFSVLDEASEKTFLCTNTAACIQKFLFDGEAEKIATELKNVVACTSYMLEQKLVEAWSADKAAEALRCQKLLVEEEEAAQKRQTELMERKRMKKLRQKGQRLKDLKEEDLPVQPPEIMDDATCYPNIQSFEAISDPDLYDQEESKYLEFPAPVTSETDNSFNVDLSVEDGISTLGLEMDNCVVLRQQAVSRHHFGKTDKLAENSFVSGSTATSKHPPLARPLDCRDPNVCSAPNRNKTWAQKVRPEIKEQYPKHELDVDDECNMAPSINSRVLIGSISVAIQDGSEHSQDFCSKNDSVPPSSKTVKHASVKVMQVTHEENRNKGIPQCDGNSMTAQNRSCSSVLTDEISYSTCGNADLAVGEHLRRTMFSSKEATAFLSQRWKEAIAADHVKLVLCPEK